MRRRKSSKSSKTKSQYKLSPASIQKHLGSKKFDSEFYHHEATPGVSLGLAYTTYGGKVLAIEANLMPSAKPGLSLTGQLGNVMKESAQAAYSFVKSQANILDISTDDINNHEIHIHIPAGAIPKDGPSAGIALASAMISAFKKTAPRPLTAMTGEITLLGKVLPIGGLKEKVLAAIRQNIDLVILPEQNRGSWDDLPQHVRRGITVRFVSQYDEVYQLLFGDTGSITHINGGSRSSAKGTDLAS